METVAVVFLVLFVVLTIAPPLAGLLIGSHIEQSHLRALDAAETNLRHIRVTDTNTAASKLGVEAGNARFVAGSVVIAPDVFRGTLSKLRLFIGGEMRWYERVLHRGRREALCRMLQEADRLGAAAVVNVRLEASNLNFWNSQQPAMVEVIAYGTAVVPAGAAGTTGAVAAGEMG